jgi:uncharacterized membrane protein
MKFKNNKRILNTISLVSLICGATVLLIGSTMHYSYVNIDIYENILKLSIVLLVAVLLINYFQYKRITLWHKSK